MIIIGLTGPTGCGKSTLARYLTQNHEFVEMEFADAIRNVLAGLVKMSKTELDHLRGKYAGIVFSDIRLESEAAFIRERGLLLHIARPDLKLSKKNVGQGDVKLHHTDQLVMNFSIELLHQQADRWVHDLQRSRVA